MCLASALQTSHSHLGFVIMKEKRNTWSFYMSVTVAQTHHVINVSSNKRHHIHHVRGERRWADSDGLKKNSSGGAYGSKLTNVCYLQRHYYPDHCSLARLRYHSSLWLAIFFTIWHLVFTVCLSVCICMRICVCVCVVGLHTRFNDNTIWEEAGCSSLPLFHCDAGKWTRQRKRCAGTRTHQII